MTIQETQVFKSEFKAVVYTKGLITKQKFYLKKLHAFDRNDSHKKSILSALDELDRLRAKYNEQLKGKTYEEWLMLSQRISALTARLNKAKMRNTIPKIEQQITDLKF